MTYYGSYLNVGYWPITSIDQSSAIDKPRVKYFS